MKILAPLLTVFTLLLIPTLPAEALSLSYNLLLKMNSQHFGLPDTPVASSFGNEAIPQSISMPEKTEASRFSDNFLNEINAEVPELWIEETDTPNPYLVPEPASLILLGAGLIGLAGLNRRWIKSHG